ncbi:protein split ends-like isoform X1 [Mytilus edulis]|uniref:protein split ends-like isoform X1 n=1 Tax=Mytilus edulis TaxID=6550 RepID=UPI0039EE4255
MVRETRYLLVGNLPENVTEEEISEYFKRFSKIQSVKIHGKKESEDFVCATVAFADIKSASKANNADNSLCGKVLTTAYSEGSATGSVVKRTLDEPRPSFSAIRPSTFPRKGPEDGEVYEGRDYYSSQLGQYNTGYTEEYQRGRPRDRFPPRGGGFKQFDRGGHHQWTAGRRFGEGHRSNSSSDRDAFEKPRPPQSPARSTSQTSRKSPKMKRKQSNSTSRSRSGSSDSSSSSSYSDSSSDSSRSRSKSGSRSGSRAGRSKLPSTGSQVKSGRSRSQESIGSDNTETTEGGGRPHGIRITNLPGRSSDTSLRDGLFHEYKKYGKVNAVQISGNGDGRYAIVSFKKSEDARKANVASQDKRFFGANIRVSEHEGIDVDDAEFRPPEAELDEHHPKATRTLFVGNLEKEITMEELKDMFSKYGDILDIDVKRQGAISAYSFIQFTDIRSVVKALRALDGETMGGMKLKLGFGKSMPTNCVWVDNLADTVQEKFLFRQFNRYGPVSNMVIDRERGKALIFFSSLESAQFALSEMRNRILNGQKIQIDFGSRDCQTDFYDKMEKSGQLKPGQRSSVTYQRQTSDTQRPERGRGKFPFPRGRGFVRGGRGGRYIAGHTAGYGGKEYHEDYKWQRYNEEYSQSGGGGGTPFEGDFETDLHAYRTQRERQRSCSPDQYSDDMYSESYREYKTRYAEYPGGGSPGSDETYDYKNRDEIYYKERYVIGSREASPEGSFHGREWSNSPTRNRVKDPERNTPPTPLGGEDTQDFSSHEQSPSEMDSENKRSGKDDFDITDADIQELRTSNKYSAHRKESLSRSEERYARKRSYDDSFTRDSLSKEDLSVRKLDRQLSHGSHDKLSESKRDLFHKMKKLQSEIGNKSEGQCSSNSSDSDRGSLTGGDLSKLKHERQLLLEKIKMCEDTNNSDTDRLDKSPLKRPRLDPWSGKSASGQRLQSELGSVIMGPKKEKSYDVSQSYRKQMETIRKNEEKSVKDKKNDIYSYDDDKEDLIPQGLLSPKDVPTAFVKKRKKTEASDEKSRMYRQKREIEDERMSSDNEESAKNVTRTDSVGSLGSIRRLSSGHSSPRTPITGHLSLESIDHRLSESEQSLTFKKLDSSKRRSKDDHSTSPVIIPLGEDILVTDIPDPRVPKEKCEEDFCLPLPKFAEYTPPVKLNSPHSENSGDVSKEDSPCFSPPSSGSKNESPQLSPNDTNSEESHTLSNQEPTYIPEEISNNSNEPTIDTLENQDMETVKPHTEVDLDEGLSDASDHNDDFCLEERIRKLDEKLNQLPTTQPSKLGTENVSSTSIGINMSSSNPPTNIYSKFKIKKRQDSNGVGQEENSEKGDKPSSEIVKTMLNRSSIFDLDSKRLEQINEKYSPNMKSVVSNADDSPKGVTLRTKAETKEMPLSTLPGSLAGRLGNGGSSFPTLSVNTQPTVPLSVKIDDKPVNSLSPGSLKGPFSHDQNSQENKSADMCSYNSDNRIYNMSDRMDVQNPVTINYSPRFNSIDNGINKTSLATLSTRTIVESAIETAEKSDNLSPVDSNVKSDPRLNSKNALYNKANKISDDNLDFNKKLDTRKSPSKSLDMNSSKIEVKNESGLKNDIAPDHILGSKTSKSDNVEDSSADIPSSVSIERKRKSETPSKKDKIKNAESKTVSPSDTEKESSKSEVKSGSESPESKRAKISSPEKDKSETNSPTHSESSKSDKLKKDSDKKNKESKKKEKSECDSMNKDKDFNDKKDKDHDGDKTKSSAKNVENESKIDDKSVKLPSDLLKKEPLNKTEGKDTDKSQSKKDTEKKTEHNTTKKEKKSDGSSSKKSAESKTDSAHKKESKSSDSKTKDKTKSSHKTKDSSKQKDGKSSGKASKSGSTEKVEQTKDQVKETVPTTENIDKKELKESEIKSLEKSQDATKEKTEKSSENLKEKEKSTDVSKDKAVPTTSEKPKDNKHKAKIDKSKDKSGESAKHKAKSETSEQHKNKSSHDNSKKEKSAEKTKHTKPKDKTSSENVKSKDKSEDSKQTTAEKPSEPDSNVKNELKGAESELAKSAEKLKSNEDVKTKEKSENGKQKEKSGNGSTLKKEKSENEKPKSTDSSTKTKEKTKHADGSRGKKSKEDKLKSTTAASAIDKTTKDKSHKDNNKKDEDRSKSDAKKEGNGDNKSSSANKTSTDSSNASKTSTETSKTSTDNSNASKSPTDSSNTSKTSTDNSNTSKSSTDNSNASKTTNEGSNSSDKKENNGNNHDNKSENKSEKTENKNDGKSENNSGNTDSLSKSSDKSESKKERKKSGEKSSSKSSGKKSSSDKKSDGKSSDKKSSKKDKENKKEEKKEEKKSPKEDKHKSTPKKEVEFDWSAWVEEPYVSMYDRVKRKSSEKTKEREMQVTRKRDFNSLTKRRNNKKHNKFGDSDDSDFSHDSAEETDAFEEEKVAKPSKEVVNDKSDNGPKRKRCIIDDSTSSDDDDSQFYKSFQKNSLNNKEKSKGLPGKSNKHSVNDIYSSDSSETDIDFPPISPAKKKIKKTKTKSKKPQIHHDTDSDLEHGKENQKKKKSISSKPKPKSTPKKKSDVKAPAVTTQTDTHESDMLDIDSGDMDIFDRIKLKNHKKKEAIKDAVTPNARRFDTTTDDSDNHLFSPNKISMAKTETKPTAKKHTILSDLTSDSDSSFPDLSPKKNCVTKKNHTMESKKPAVTVGAGVTAQTIRMEDLGEKKDEIKKKDDDLKKKEKTKKKSKKNEIMKSDEKNAVEDAKSLFEKMDNIITTQGDLKDKNSKHKKEGKSPKDLPYLDEEEISQAEKLVNNMNKLEKPMKHDSAKLNKTSKQDHEKTSTKNKTSKLDKMDHTFSSETETDKESKSHSIDHVTKSESESRKDADDKKTEQSVKTKPIKTKKKKHDSISMDSVPKVTPEVSEKKDVDTTKKVNNKHDKIESIDNISKKKINKIEIEDMVAKKPPCKLDMDDGLLKQHNKHNNKVDKDIGYKIGFGFFEDFPILEESKLDDIPKKKESKEKEKKPKKNKDDEPKTPKKEAVKSEGKTPKKKDRKKKDGTTEMITKENGPKLEELVGKLAAGAMHNSDVFDFQDEDDNKPLFADFFKMKEEMTKKAAATKKDKPDGKKENRLSSEEKSEESESHEDVEDGKKSGPKDKKDKVKSDEAKNIMEKLEESLKDGLFGPNPGSKIDESSITNMFSSKHVKEACKEEAKNIMGFASPKGMVKSDDESCKSLTSPTKSEIISPKDKYRRDMVVGHVDFDSFTDINKKDMEVKSKEISSAEEKWRELIAGKEDAYSKKIDIFTDNLTPKSNVHTDKSKEEQKGKVEEKIPEKTEVPEKSREEIVEEAVSSLQKITETPSVVTPDDDNYQDGGLVIDETTAAVETVTEEPVMAEQAQNETDLAILSILQFDDKSGSFPETLPQQNALVSEPQPEVPPENVVVEPEQITLDTNPLDSSIGSENDLVIDTSTPDQVELQNDINLPITAPIKEKPVEAPIQKPVVTPIQKPVVAPIKEKQVTAPIKEKPLKGPIKEKPVTAPIQEKPIAAPIQEKALAAPIKEKPISVPGPTSVPVEPRKETILPAMPPVQEKPLEHKEKPKSRRNQKAKEQIELLNAQKEQLPARSVGQVVKDNNQMFNFQPEQPMPVQQDLQAQFYGQMMADAKQIISKQIPEVQKPEPYRKTRKQKANAKANHQIEVPGTFYPPVYNAVDHSLHLTNSLQGGDASEKENEEKLPQPYNFDVEKHEDADNLRVSGDEGGSNADKRTRRGRKQQNYKEMNSGVHGRTTSPRSRSSPRSPRTGMSPRQALSPLSSPKAELTAPFVKIERLPFGCNKNVRPEGEMFNETLDGKQQIIEAVENQPENQGLTATKKLIEEIAKPAFKEATNVFDFDDNEPELKIVTTPLKATRPKKGRRNTQEAILPPQPATPEVKISPNGPNHIVSPLEGRWQCKKDSESDKNGNHPLKLRIALTHTTGMSTNTTNSISSMINSATIIDSTIPSIKEKKDLESLTKVSCATTSSIMSTIASVASNAAPTMANLCMDKMSNVDRIIDDVSKGIFDWDRGNGQIEPTKEQIMMSMSNMMPKVTDSLPIALQPTKKRHTQNRHIGELDMMPPPPMTSLSGHDLGLAKSSPSLVQPPMASSPFGLNVMSMSQGHPPVPTPPLTSAGIPVSVACTSSSHSSPVQIGEPAITSFSQARPTSQITTTKNKPLDMALNPLNPLNMMARSDVMTSAAHSLSTAAVVTQTTTTTIAQHSPGPSVVMSSQKPMVTTSGNTTVLAGRTVTVKPPNTEAYLQQMGLHPSAIPSQAPVSAHQVPMPRMPDNKQGFPHGFLPNPAFSRPEEHSRPIPASSSEKQPQVTSSAPTCVVHPITTSSGKTMDPKLLQHQQMMQAVAASRAPVVSTTSSGHSIPPAHMHLSQALLEKEQHMRTMAAMHNQPMMHLMGQPHVMTNHIQHKPEKTPKGKQSHKAELPQPNEPLQRPPSAHSQKPQSNEPQRPHSAHENQQMLHDQIRTLMGKGMIPPGAIPPHILQMYHQQQQQQQQQQMAATQQQQQMAAAKMEEKKGHKNHPPKEMVSPGIAHQPSSMFATSIASQSSNPQIKSPALAQTAPSPHPVFSQPSTSQARPISPGMKKQLNEKFNQNQWTNESIAEAQRSGPSSGEPSPSPKHWGYSGSQQPKPAHQQNLDSSSKTHQEAIRLIEQHKQQEMMRMQQQQDHAKLQEIQRQEIERREDLLRQAALKSRDGVPSTSASTSQQSDRDRQTASVPGKPRSSHLPNHSESGPSVMDPRNLHHLQELQRAGPRGHGAFAAPTGELIQGIPAHLYRDPEFQQRIHAAAALRMPHLLDPHMYPQGYPLGLPHPYLGQVGTLPIDHPHLADQRPPSQGGSSHGMRSPPPRQAHQAVAKSPAIPAQPPNRQQMPDPPPGGEGSLLSLLQRYPVMWQGTLALKNDSCAVQMHVISGFNSLVQTALPQQVVEGTCQPLRIAQRMRLESAQLEGVIKRMQYDKDYCMLLALPCGSDHDDIIYQTRAMSTGFIQYLQQKQAAGIVNVADPGSQQPAYVVHIFPPCEFSHETLGRLGFELLHQVRNLSHLLVIITTVA